MTKLLISNKQFDILDSSIDWSMKQLDHARERRISALREFVGKHYMQGGSDKIMPVNALKLAVDIYVRHLAARHPRAMLTTRDPSLRPVAKDFELALNQIPEEISLSRTLRRVVTEALFSLGIVKCGLASSGSLMGYNYGEPFVDCITMDDYFCDLSARQWELRQYEGNDYWMEYEDFQELDWSNKKDVKADDPELLSSLSGEQASAITNSSTPSVYRDRIWLRDVWLPKERLMLTYGVKSKKLFNTVEYEPDYPNPYIHLGFTWVPGNLLPLPPVAAWRDLNELANAIFRKLGASADAYKEVLGFSGGDDNNTAAFKKAKHGDGIKYTGAQPQKLTAGGIDPKSLAFYLQVKELQSYYAGSLDSLGGLAPMSATVGQDKLLSEAAGAQLRDMADQTTDFVREIFKALAYYEWNNPISSRTVQKPVPGTQDTLPVEWNSQSKRGSFSDYNIDIDVYSLQDDSPGLRLQKLGAAIQQYVLPFIPLIQQAGGSVDIEALLKTVSQYANLPELAEVVTFPDDPVTAQGSSQSYTGVPKTPETGAASGVPQQSQSADMIQQLLAGAE